MNTTELNLILEKHKLWLAGREGGERAKLPGVDIRGADLQDTSLRGANLRGARLWDAIGNNDQIRTLQTGSYIVNLYDDRMQIGCKNYSVKEWFSFNDSTISDMDKGALEWWRAWKPILKLIVEVK